MNGRTALEPLTVAGVRAHRLFPEDESHLDSKVQKNDPIFGDELMTS